MQEQRLARHALEIWKSGVRAVTPGALMQRKIHRDGRWLVFNDQAAIDLAVTRRIIVVGAGKASAAMAQELIDQHCTHNWPENFPEIVGWINTPAGVKASQPNGIRFHIARPAGINSPTEEAIAGTEQILRLVSGAGPNDVVISLISGGGSAILVAPQPGITLADKQAVAQCVAAAGGNIVQLNSIRRCISQVKGGGLVRACNAGSLISLIISDVLGDPLDIIASGPTVPDLVSDRQHALAILKQLEIQNHPRLRNVTDWLQNSPVVPKQTSSAKVDNIILGNLADAVDAAGVHAVELGYRYHMQVASQPEGDVDLVAHDVFEQMKLLRNEAEIDCWISGGEPTVKLPQGEVGAGGRNQHLALSVLNRFLLADWPGNSACTNIAFLSGGTDGEDGPTDAAGAWFDNGSIDKTLSLKISPKPYLERADSYHFFEQIGGLLITGSTGTNVGDLRVALVQNQLP